MKVFVVAIPLFDSTMEVAAYYLRDRNGERLMDVANDFRGRSIAFSASSPALVLLKRLGAEVFAGDRPLFLDLNRFMLLADAVSTLNIDPARVVCVIPADLPPDEDVLERCEALKARGYGIALDGLPAEEDKSPLLPFADYLLYSYANPHFSSWMKAAKYRIPKAKVVITNIPDTDSYHRLSINANTLFSGRFYNRPITKGLGRISPVKVNALQLLREVNEQDFELEDIAKIIERDPSLSISLLRFINSAAVGLKNKVSSIQNAVAVLGQQEVRRWATVAISVALSEDRPGEVTKLSLIRAKFAEGLATAFELGVFQQSLFMAGLFSLLDIILQRPMAEAVQEISVDKRVQEALVDRTGPLYPVLDFIYAYEHAHWDEATIMMIRNNVDIEQVNTAYVDALVWYNQLLATIDEA